MAKRKQNTSSSSDDWVEIKPSRKGDTGYDVKNSYGGPTYHTGSDMDTSKWRDVYDDRPELRDMSYKSKK